MTIDETMSEFHTLFRGIVLQLCPRPVRAWIEGLERRAFVAGVERGELAARVAIAEAIEPELEFLEFQGRVMSVRVIRKAVDSR